MTIDRPMFPKLSGSWPDRDGQDAQVRQQAHGADDPQQPDTRSSVAFSLTPGTKPAPITTKSKTFQPLLKKSGRRGR